MSTMDVGLAARLMMEAYKRLGPGRLPHQETLPPQLRDLLHGAAWSDAGYCLDAPDILPAGSVASEQISDDEWSPLPTECWRQST